MQQGRNSKNNSSANRNTKTSDISFLVIEY